MGGSVGSSQMDVRKALGLGMVIVSAIWRAFPRPLANTKLAAGDLGSFEGGGPIDKLAAVSPVAVSWLITRPASTSQVEHPAKPPALSW
jgi:hypothetical protein